MKVSKSEAAFFVNTMNGVYKNVDHQNTAGSISFVMNVANTVKVLQSMQMHFRRHSDELT